MHKCIQTRLPKKKESHTTISNIIGTLFSVRKKREREGERGMEKGGGGMGSKNISVIALRTY